MEQQSRVFVSWERATECVPADALDRMLTVMNVTRVAAGLAPLTAADVRRRVLGPNEPDATWDQLVNILWLALSAIYEDMPAESVQSMN